MQINYSCYIFSIRFTLYIFTLHIHTFQLLSYLKVTLIVRFTLTVSLMVRSRREDITYCKRTLRFQTKRFSVTVRRLRAAQRKCDSRSGGGIKSIPISVIRGNRIIYGEEHTRSFLLHLNCCSHSPGIFIEYSVYIHTVLYQWGNFTTQCDFIWNEAQGFFQN